MRNRETWWFILAVFAASWLLWGGAIQAPNRGVTLALVALGASTPSAAGIALTYLWGGRHERRIFWQRVINPRRIGLKWGAVAFLLYPLINALAASVFILSGGALPPAAQVWAERARPAALIELVAANLVAGALSEELGWRGYLLDRLQGRRSALAASLILGLLHGVWHTPLFLIPGLTQGEMGLVSLDYALFVATTIGLSVVYTWVYNHTRRSTLVAILLHFMANLTLGLVVGLHGAAPTGYSAAYAAVHAALCVVLVARYGAQTLADGAQHISQQGQGEKTSPSSASSSA